MIKPTLDIPIKIGFIYFRILELLWYVDGFRGLAFKMKLSFFSIPVLLQYYTDGETLAEYGDVRNVLY